MTASERTITITLHAHGGPRGPQVPSEVRRLARESGRAHHSGRLSDRHGEPDEAGIHGWYTVHATVAWEGPVYSVCDVRRGASRGCMRILAIGDGYYVERDSGLRRWVGPLPEPGEMWCWMSHDAIQGTGDPVYGPPPENAAELRPNARGVSAFCLAYRREEAERYIAAARARFAPGAWGRPWDWESRLRMEEELYRRNLESIERDAAE